MLGLKIKVLVYKFNNYTTISKYKFILLFLLCHSSGYVFSQISAEHYNILPDSLKPRDKNHLTIDEKRRVLNNFNDVFPDVYNNELQMLTNTLEKDISFIDDKRKKVEAKTSLVAFYLKIHDSNFDSTHKALNYSRQIVKIINKDKAYNNSLALTYANMGTAFYYLRKADSAAKYAQLSLDITSPSDSLLLQRIYSLYARTYGYLDLLNQAFGYAKQEISLYNRNQKWRGFYTENRLINAFYYHKAYLKYKDKKYVDSTHNLIRAVMKAKQNESQYWFGACYLILARTAYEMEDYKQTIIFADSSLLSFYNKHSLFWPNYHHVKYLYKAFSLIKLGNFKQGKKLLDSINIENKPIITRRSTYEVLYKYFEKTKDWEKTFAYYYKFKAMSDSIDIIGQKGHIFELEQKYQFDKKEQANILLQKEKDEYLLFIGIGSILSLIIALLSYYLYRQLVKQHKLTHLRDEFYTMLAHDLRSSIGTFKLLGSVLTHLTGKNHNADLARLSKQIESVGTQTWLQLNNMLEWGKVNNYKIMTQQETEAVDISEILNELYVNYKPFTEVHDINLILEIPDKLKAKTDAKSFNIIIRNMIDNAQKYTQRGGEIKIFYENTGPNKKAIHIKNSGNHIPLEKLKYIQNVFTGYTKPEVGENGLGLGIILMNDFAQKSNTKLWVTSEQDEGTCFSLFFNEFI